MTQRFPTVSIVTPTYNQSDFLEETIQSVLEQDYPNIEYIVIDDGSTDNTPAILEKYSGKIIWESQSNQGQTPTINKGWQMSRGDFIAYLNSDDTYILPNAVRKGVEFLLAHPDVAMVFGDAFEINERSQIVARKNVPDKDFKGLLKEWIDTLQWPIVQPSTFLRRNVLDDVGYLDTSIYYAMDMEYWTRLGVTRKMAHLPEPLSCFRLHYRSKTVSSHAKNAPDYLKIYNKLFSRDDLPQEIKQLQRRAKSSAYLRTAKAYHAALDYPRSRYYMLKGLSYYPPHISRMWVRRLLVTVLKELSP
jgi:glycosyltransferase involved in cell wall biosynthesis